ncbi:hypothetical protein D3C78_1465990 [compost metagenome]
MRSCDSDEDGIGETGSIAVAALKAQTDRLADRQAGQVRVGLQGRGEELAQGRDRHQGSRVLHQWQIDEFLDAAVPEQ